MRACSEAKWFSKFLAVDIRACGLVVFFLQRFSWAVIMPLHTCFLAFFLVQTTHVKSAL